MDREAHTDQNWQRWLNIIEVMIDRALSLPNDIAFTFLKDGEQEHASLTFGELGRRAQRVGTALRKLGGAGERVLLLYPQGLDFIIAFFGALYAGAVAVPAPLQKNSRSARLIGIIEEARPVIALTNLAMFPRASQHLACSATAPALLSLEEILERIPSHDDAPRRPDYEIGKDSLAFLQFTSGSTSAPKGVMITHANLLHNQRLIERLYEHSRDTVGVCWLPMFHDMGLVGNVLQPVYVGYRSVLMSPGAFLQEPSRWLQAITRYRATTAGGPNFGYDLCVDRTTAEQRQSLDLSTWDIAYNGSEPVRARTLDRFAEAFGQFGFRRRSFYPTYGMAEATLLISGGIKAAEPVIRPLHNSLSSLNMGDSSPVQQTPKMVVGCGGIGPGDRLVIVDPVTKRPLPDGETGEIWFAGPSVSPGYWNRHQQSVATFNVCLAGTHDACFMRTGDLGFMEHGELFVTGRINDLIIVRGLNHYPEDIEETAQASHPALRTGFGAAFEIDIEEAQRLVFVNEVRRQCLCKLPLTEIAGNVRAAVVKEHGLQVAAVILLRTATIPKTSSGKIQRNLCRSLLLAGLLDVVGESWYGPTICKPAKLPAICDQRIGA